MLKISSSSVVFQEVPGEISLALSISGCPLRCKGCHSANTRNPSLGEYLTRDTIDTLLTKHKHITCILFYGGEWEHNNLIALCNYIKTKELKICLYTGREEEELHEDLLYYLDYLKTGPYVEELGGLYSPTTNQKFRKM